MAVPHAAPDIGNEQPSHPAHAVKAKTEQDFDQAKDRFEPQHADAVRAAEQSLQPGATGVNISSDGYGVGPVTGGSSHLVEVISGPLLNYRRTTDPNGPSPVWHGTVLVVAKSGGKQPSLKLRRLDSVLPKDSQLNGLQNGHSSAEGQSQSEVQSVKLYSDPTKTFWCFALAVPISEQESRWEYSVSDVSYQYEAKLTSGARSFVVPARSQSMRMMFHSCNGFSAGTDTSQWAGGPVLWNDVIRVHETKPFHVMIGGGDQIYNDGVRVGGPLSEWTSIANPKKRREYPFGAKLRDDCDAYYYKNYVEWYNTEPFAQANGQIPQLNIWDDHDIIDGFGSYTDHFMKCPVFRGIGSIAFKYYCLFQHHLPPPRSTFTTDSPETTHGLGLDGPGIDAHQLTDTYIAKTDQGLDDSFIIGSKPGPYMEERSRSIYARLGARVAFLGIDARTERTRHQVNYPETYDLLFDRLEREFTSAQDGIRHLILLLGVPIAYPRLSWVENLINSPLIGPIRVLNKRFGFAGGLFNKFDGQVEILDDLDDHYTAHAHKAERKALIQRLQDFAKKHSARVTILGGDVHLAATGRFYSKPQRDLPSEKDHRYMANVISSAITNKPPPQVLANFLARRNRIHRLDLDTHETLFKLFDKDPGVDDGAARKTGKANHVTMPSRNYAILSEAPTEALVDGASNGENGQSAPVADTHPSNVALEVS